MALKIIGAGFGRTGTASVQLALNQLGFPCYHMFEVLGNPRNRGHLAFWCEVTDAPSGAQHDWDRVFTEYTAVVDNPGCCVWRELLQAYPDAKVLLTLHPGGPQAWYESTIETIYSTETKWQFKVLEWCTPFGRKFGRMSHKLIWQRSHQGTMPDREQAIAHYRRHVEEVRAAVPAERLLVFSVDQGWAPLCDFLGVPAPDAPFPKVNDRAAIQGAFRKMVRGAYVILTVAALVLAAAIYGAVWCIWR